MADDTKKDSTIFEWANGMMGSGKILIGTLAIGIMVGLGGTKFIGYFVDSQTDTHFTRITDREDRFEDETKDRFILDEKRLDDHGQKIEKFNDLQTQLAVIQTQLVTMAGQIADIRRTLEAGNFRRKVDIDQNSIAQPVIATTDKDKP